MFFRYGAHQHPANEVNLVNFEAHRRFNERGHQTTILYRMFITGELQYVGQAAIHAAIQEFLAAYAIPNQNAGLYHDDGTPTRHLLVANDPNNLTGNRVLVHAWPRGEPEEYATTRTFHVTIEAEYRAIEAELQAWFERVRVIGHGGIRYRWLEFAQGPPQRQIVNLQSMQELVQEGFAVGFDGYPLIHVPPPLYPALELPDLRQITTDAPTYRGNAFTNFRMEWRYVMQSPVHVNGFPHLIF
jgi:hypothetical protein